MNIVVSITNVAMSVQIVKSEKKVSSSLKTGAMLLGLGSKWML